MKPKVCLKHRDNPATIYGKCVGCEIDGLRKERDEARAENVRLQGITDKYCQQLAQEQMYTFKMEQELAALNLQLSDNHDRAEEIISAREQQIERLHTDLSGRTYCHSDAQVEARCQELEAEVKHWKANHACEVERAIVLKERIDMPLERVSAYEQIGKLQSEKTSLETAYNRRVKDCEDLFFLRRVVFQIGKQLEGYELDQEDISRFGKQLMAESRICPTCEGDGMGGDPDGGSGPCEDCNGATLLDRSMSVLEAHATGRREATQELEAAIIEIGQLKQGMWQMKDAEISRWKDAYENMRDFAVKSGLDIVCYGTDSVEAAAQGGSNEEV